MAIRNAAIQKTAPAVGQNGYGVSKVETVRRAANDNRPAAANNNRQPIARSRPFPDPVPKGPAVLAGATVPIAETLNGISLFAQVIAKTWYPYPIQLIFGILCFLGLGIASGLDESALAKSVDFVTLGSVSDAGGALFLIGLVGALIFGILLAAAEAIMMSIQGVNPLRGMSWFVLALCTILHLVPILNLFPIMWLWCLYVSLAKE